VSDPCRGARRRQRAPRWRAVGARRNLAALPLIAACVRPVQNFRDLMVANCNYGVAKQVRKPPIVYEKVVLFADQAYGKARRQGSVFLGILADAENLGSAEP